MKQAKLFPSKTPTKKQVEEQKILDLLKKYNEARAQIGSLFPGGATPIADLRPAEAMVDKNMVRCIRALAEEL